MNRNTKLIRLGSRLLSGAALGALAVGGAAAQSIGDEIVVTAQRTEQSLQDVPLSVSAFGGDDLQARQLESFSDIQFNVPSFQFSRTQFTGSAVSIRGIGNFLVAASSENAVSTHINDVFISAPRLFETEFFDVERLEILRGPQGTLFGRNATGGVMNVITKKANPDEVEGYVDAEYGNYESVKVNGAINVPLSDSLAIRLAGTTIQRDGFTDNLFDGSEIDDRNIYALRASTRWLMGDNTTLDFMASYMREDDNRMRYQKQACEAGPQRALLGCDPTGPRAFDSVDLRATFLANTSGTTFALAGAGLGLPPSIAAYGLTSLAAPILGSPQPADLRSVSWDTKPKYDAEETIFMVNFRHDFDALTLRVNSGWGNSKIQTSMDFDGGVGPVLTRPSTICGAGGPFGPLGGVCALTGGAAGPATFPVSAFDVGITGNPNGLVGVIGGFEQARSNRFQSIDMSIGEEDYWSVEGIINSDFEGPFNFLIGSNHIETNGFADYAVATTGLDYFAYTFGTIVATGLGAPGAPGLAYSFYVPYFWNDTDDNHLNSTSLFGEIYVDLADNLKLTGGIRHNWDTKGLRDRGSILESSGSSVTGVPASVPPIVPFGTPSVRFLLDANELVQCPSLGAYCGNGGRNDFRVIEEDFDSTTGRAVLQWSFADDAQLYFSWTRGFKPGGFNPRTLTAGVPLTFEPEVINAYELGLKSQLGNLQANLTGFYYDYSGLQVSRIVANTSVNENIDATIWGLEGEFVWQPGDQWTFNMNAAYLNTELGTFSTIDVRNPTAGRTDVDLIADITTGQNCVATRQPGDISMIGNFTGNASLDPLLASNFSICSALAANIAAINALNGPDGTYAIVSGIEQSVTGNDMLGAPHFKISGGVQWAIPMGGFELTPRVDAYYQTQMYTTIFNTEQDLIDGYGYLNAQVRFAPTDGNWYVRFFMQNVTDNDAITGAFDSGQSAGNFQNLFILEPRRWGFGVGMTF